MSKLYELLMLLWMIPAIVVLQIINLVFTTVEYYTTTHLCNNIQELFTINSKYLSKVFKQGK